MQSLGGVCTITNGVHRRVLLLHTRKTSTLVVQHLNLKAAARRELCGSFKADKANG
jgi:hypothetical protein